MEAILNNAVNISDVVRPVATTISKQPYGILNGIKAVDVITFGYQGGELTVLAGRSSMGKSAYAIDVILNASKEHNVLFFSLEMSTKIIIQRMLTNLSEVSLNKLKTNDLTETEQARFQQAIIGLEQRKIFIDDSSLLTPVQCYKKIQLLNDKNKIDLVVIDFLQLMSTGKPDTGNLAQNVDEICRNLRATAKHFNIPLLLLSQLNRKVEDRQGHEPRLSDLRDSGGIEQVADVVLLLHRPSYYEMREVTVEAEDNGQAFILVAKNRNGATGKIPVVWLGDIMSFKELNWNF